jgi:tripartite-type tricarboxylate transporter receptor subunit TctC
MPQIDRRTLSLLGLSTLLAPSRVLAQDAFPSRPVHLIVGFTPGAASDVIGRIFANGAGPALGQQVVVENKPGAGSSIAAEYVARAPKDGYTFLVLAQSTLTDSIVNTRSTDVIRDFAPIALMGAFAVVMIVSPDLKVKTLGEFIALAKAKPGQLLFGSVGLGTHPHLCAVMLLQRAGIDLVHVPYPGSPQATEDVIAGRISMFFAPASAIVGQVTAGKVIALATAGDKRTSVLPEVPTMAEAGIPDFNAPLWLGLAAPADTPRPIIDRLAGATRQALHSADAIGAMQKQGFDPVDSGPDQFGAFLRSENARWSEVARAAGLKS